jgi:hypothetical protein
VHVAAGAFRGAPASTIATRRRARDSTSAADSPAAPPPITATSYAPMPSTLVLVSSLACGAGPMRAGCFLRELEGRALTVPAEPTTPVDSAAARMGWRFRPVARSATAANSTSSPISPLPQLQLLWSLVVAKLLGTPRHRRRRR